MSRIAIIPARSGSKGLKDKNILLLEGKPLISYTIEAALKSQIFDKVFVSTDSQKYANIAIEYGADASFLRSAENASDNASSWDTVREVIKKFSEEKKNYDEIMLLQPTSPLRTASDIIESLNIFHYKNANAVLSVTEMEHSPLWSNQLPKNLCMDNFIRDEYEVPRQQLPKYYRINGAIYLLKKEELFKKKMFKDNCYAYIMPQDRSVDIDSEFDFKIAEVYLENNY
jgi:CMP-N,N'-diacetyllegionaminic acid synthase